MKDTLKKNIEKWTNNNNKDILIGNCVINQNSLLFNANNYLTDSEALKSSVFSNELSSLKNTVENELSKFVKYETALIMQSGYAANHDLMQVIACKFSFVIFIDSSAHMSLIQGVKNSKSKLVFFKHNDFIDLEEKIKEYGAGIILVESVYSVEGDLCNLKKVVEISKSTKSILVVDESHSFGVYGKKGEGLVHELGLQKDVDIITSSLSKAFCFRAGVIFCSNKMKDFIKYKGFNSIFSSGISQEDCLNLSNKLKEIKTFYQRRSKLKKISSYFREELNKINIDTVSQSHIVSIKFKKENIKFARDSFEKKNIFPSVFLYPAVKKNKPSLRFTLSYDHKKKDIDKVIRILKQIK